MGCRRLVPIFLLALIAGLPQVSGDAAAGEADVSKVEVSKQSDGTYRFDVTVEHADEGWDHYADAWEIVGSDGVVLATRELLHPHVNEQPFTRSLSNISIPANMETVLVRAHDSVHGFGGREISVELPQ